MAVHHIQLTSSQNRDNLCQSIQDPGVLFFETFFYWSSSNIDLSLSEIVDNNIPIFITEQAATDFGEGNNDDLNGTAQTAYYREFDQLFFSFWLNDGSKSAWKDDESDTCPAVPNLQSFEIELFSDFNSNTVEGWCCSGDPILNTYYYYSENQYDDLIDIVNNGIILFKSESGAIENNINDLIEYGIYGINDSTLLIFTTNLNNNPTWVGLDSFNNTTESPNITKYFLCSDYVRSTGNNSFIITGSSSFANRVYYSFWACSPIRGEFKMYVVDGKHFTTETNFISDFIETLEEKELPVIFTGTELGCVSLKHKITAESIEEAVNLVKNSSPDYNLVLESSISDLGIGDNVLLDIYNNCCDCIKETNGNKYQFSEIGIPAPTLLGPNFQVERNAKLDNIAKPLLRTNPKLTTNVKLVVNSNDKIYLDSIDATDTLASADYKKFPISPNSSYAYDLSRFYTKNNTPLEIAYTTKRRDSDFSVYAEYEKQIEEDYQYGTTLNYSKLYNEEFKIFAPIYVDLNMPKKFVIYRVKDPKPAFNIQDSAAGNAERIKRLVDNSDIVKVFDLTKSSNIGKYLRNYVQDQSFPKSPITFSFEENEKTTFNGIDLIKGGFTQKAEYVHNDFILKDKPMIAANDFITDGFRRNNLAVANVINMEFLFDDPEASTYSVNRYIGIYVDNIETGSGNISTINRGDIRFNSVESKMDSTFNYAAIPSYKMLNTMPILTYVSAGENYYRINSTEPYDHSRLEVKVLDPLNKIPGQLGIKETGESIDIKADSSAGFDFIKAKIVDRPDFNNKIALINVRKESYRFTFIKFVANKNIEIEDSVGNTIIFDTGSDLADAISNLEVSYNNNIQFSNVYSLETNVVNGKASFILTEKQSNLLKLSPSVTLLNQSILNKEIVYSDVEINNNSYYAAEHDSLSPNYLPKGTFKGQYFSSDGSNIDIAIALTKLINSKGNFNAFNIGDEIYISTKISGYKLLQHALLISLNNAVPFLEIQNVNIDTKNKLKLSNVALSTWDSYFFKGGNITNKSVLVSKETAPILNIGDYLPTAYRNRYNKVIDVVENIKDLNGDYLRVILDLENSITSGDVMLFAERNLVMGLFSAYSIYDMDFDFHDTSNSELKELKHETINQIIYDPYNDTVNINVGANDLSLTDILSEDYTIEPSKYFANLQPLLTNETVDDNVVDQIFSEYDRLNENEIKEFAIGSRVVPNINKWVLKNGMTVREEPYHLNTYSAFGRTNFTPDLEVTERDRKAFTHEWFYIENIPDYLRFWQINDTFSYVNFIKGFDLSKPQFKRSDKDYFDMFMVGEGHEIELYNQNPLSTDTTLFNINAFVKSNIHKKYTIVDNGSSATFASTIFKGLNVVFKKRKEFTNRVASEFVRNTEFNGYKFSVLLKINNQSRNNSLEYEVIQNKKFKFIIFYITLNTNDIFTSDVNRKLLYEIKHQLLFNTNNGRYEYADVKISGALDLKSVNFIGNGPFRVFGITHNDKGEPNFTSQISKNQLGVYNRLQIDLGNIGIYEVKILSVESDLELLIEGVPTKVGGNSTDPDYHLDTVGLNIVDLKRASYNYIKGGFGAQELLLNELTAGNVASLLNKNDDQVTYTTIEVDGTIHNNRFTINFLDGKEIIKKVDLGVVEDIKKPKSYKLSKDIIGYNIVRTNEYFDFIVRHSGDYIIDLEPVVTFSDIYTHFKTNRRQSTLDLFESVFKSALYKHSLSSTSEINIARSYYNKFNRCGVAFNIGFIKDSNILGVTSGERITPQAGLHDFTFGKIKNHYYHKVNEINPNGVLKLTKGGDFLPVYPLVDEIAIDYKDINVFMSSWEDNYYTRSLASGININVPGTFDTAEERSYLGSTAMKLDNFYLLSEFSIQRVSSEEELNDILRTSNNDNDVVIYEDNQILLADFYMNDIVFKKLSDAGALNTLKHFIEPKKSIGDKTTLIDDMRDYVNKNIIQVFTLDKIDLFVNKFKGGRSNILSTFNIDTLDHDISVPDSSFTYKLHGDLPLNFRLIYNKRLGYSYNIRPIIKIQS